MEEKPISKAKKTPDGKKKPKANRDDALAEQLSELVRQMRASFSVRLLQLDLYGGQERIILHLKNHDGQAPGVIAKELGVSAPTIAKSIHRLAQRGFVVRRLDAADKRRATVHLTNLGHSTVKAIRKEKKKWRKHMFDDLSNKQKKKLSNLLSKIGKNVIEHQN